MRDYRVRTDLSRSVIGGFQLPLGLEPSQLEAPTQGFTLSYTAGQNDDPDTYSFHVVVSHEKLPAIIRQAFELLSLEVFPIIEIGSRDAYRSVDVYIAPEPLHMDDFLATWNRFEQLLLEDATIAAGANGEDPFVEVFVDQWKGLSIHTPLAMREQVESMLQRWGLTEVPQTWDNDERRFQMTNVRSILEVQDEYSPDLDELLLDLRHEWRLELSVDPDRNLDEQGRELGRTLWHAVVIVEPADGDTNRGAYALIWATAGSLSEMEDQIQEALSAHPQWSFSEIYTIDRIAYDERPEELVDLQPKRGDPEVHLLRFDPWEAMADEA